jgi:hypothetical protein
MVLNVAGFGPIMPCGLSGIATPVTLLVIPGFTVSLFHCTVFLPTFVAQNYKPHFNNLSWLKEF